MEADAIPNGAPPIWKIWANPIVRRYARSRLRPRGLGIALLLTTLLAGFVFFVFRMNSYRNGNAVIDAERSPLITLLIIQGLILFVLATGQVAGAMTSEADEGVLDYQRLAPMTPLAKVIGYLFGLPIREYVLFASTMPFTLWSLWRGQVPWEIAAQLYGVFLIAAVLYHLTGLLAGTVVKNRRWAFLVSMGLVFLLYTVIPQAAKFGLVYFKYLTITPVVTEFLPHLVSRDVGAFVETAQRLIPSARFFNLDLPQSVFTVLSQSVFILTMIVMLWRRWSRAESHLLGKVGATGLFAWFQVVLIGNALPLIEPGTLFPSQAFRRFGFVRRVQSYWEPEPSEAILMAGAFGLVTLMILWVMTMMITPDANGQIRGWRRARKLGARSLSPVSDPATAFPWVGIMVAIGVGGWFWFSKAIIESKWYPNQEMPLRALVAFAMVMASGGFGFHALLEGKGARAAGLAVIFVGVVPIMAGTILAASSGRLVSAAMWLIGISPAVGPIFGSATELPAGDLPSDLYRAIPRAFWFWQSLACLVALSLVRNLRKSRKAIAESSGGEGFNSAPDS